MKLFITLLLWLVSLLAFGMKEESECALFDKDTIALKNDSITWMRANHDEWINRGKKQIKKQIRKLNDVDTSYIEPQRYNYTFMVQNTNAYEVYRLHTESGTDVVFAPNMSLRVGPYFGYRWIFIGYTIDVTHLYDEVNDRTDFNLSLYSNKIGLDLFYRKTGDGYYIRKLSFGEDFDGSALKNVEFSGIKTSVKGFNAYYIFNHRKFSYPAAFSQSTVQRRSAGSPLIGIAYNSQKVDVDWRMLNNLIEEKTGQENVVQQHDSTLSFTTFHYDDFSITGGYAYNWVFARNWLLDASMSVGLSYKKSRSDTKSKWYTFRDFTVKDLNVDGTFRFALVWNNTKWYAGMSMVMHGFNYRRENFSADNMFGTLNIYTGFNFGKKDKKRKKKKS